MFDPLTPGGPDDPGRAPGTEADAPSERVKPAWWLWSIVGVILLVLIVASVIIGMKSPGGDSSKAGAAGSNQSASPSPSSTEATSAPGMFGAPSMPASDPVDPWQGAHPIAGVDPDAFKAALTSKWQLDWRSRPTRGGIQQSGLGGDLDRKQRRLDAIIKTGANYATYQVMCQAGGTKVTPPEETSITFVYDCLAQAVKGPEWDQIKGWLDQNLKSLADTGGSSWYQLPALRMYVESDRHIVSCSLVNF